MSFGKPVSLGENALKLSWLTGLDNSTLQSGLRWSIYFLSLSCPWELLKKLHQNPTDKQLKSDLQSQPRLELSPSKPHSSKCCLQFAGPAGLEGALGTRRQIRGHFHLPNATVSLPIFLNKHIKKHKCNFYSYHQAACTSGSLSLVTEPSCQGACSAIRFVQNPGNLQALP